MTNGVILLFAFVALIFVMFAIPRVASPRRSIVEGIEDPKVAEAYDRISRWPQFKLIRRMFVRELKKYHPTGIIVDIGCGPGYLSALIAKTFPHLQVIGVDIADEMIDLASHNASSVGLDKYIEYRKGDVNQLPFEAGTVDFVVSTFSLHHWLDPEQAMHEINRVLKPEGQFLLFDFRRDCRRMFYWLFRVLQRIVVPEALRRINEPVNSILSSYTPVEMEALLARTTFNQWNVEPGFGWMFIRGHKSITAKT